MILSIYTNAGMYVINLVGIFLASIFLSELFSPGVSAEP